MTPVEQAERAHALVLSMSPSARLTYSVAGTRKYELPVTEVTLAGVFERMLHAAADQDLNVLDWGIANATLEEVFIKVGAWWGCLASCSRMAVSAKGKNGEGGSRAPSRQAWQSLTLRQTPRPLSNAHAHSLQRTWASRAASKSLYRA